MKRFVLPADLLDVVRFANSMGIIRLRPAWMDALVSLDAATATSIDTIVKVPSTMNRELAHIHDVRTI